MTSVIVMPWMPCAGSAFLTSSSLKMRTIASTFFIACALSKRESLAARALGAARLIALANYTTTG